MFPISIFARAFAGAGVIACAACVGPAPKSTRSEAPRTFYTVTGEIALSRHEPRIAALEYVAAAETATDAGLLQHAADVTAQCLQPSLTLDVARRWMDIDPAAVEAHRAAGRAALELYDIGKAAAQYRIVLISSPRGADAEFAALEVELATTDNIYGARQLADRLAADFPDAAPALRMQAFAALRADDPAAAVRSFNAALARPGPMASAAADSGAQDARRLTQGLWRARILDGDVDEPLSQARALVARENSGENRLQYAVLLLAAQQNSAARTELAGLVNDPSAAPEALRLLGLVDFQDGKLDDAGVRFAQLLVTGKFPDDAFYYLGLIAERHGDIERALRFYAQVQNGENVLPALLRAATLLRAHGAAPAAEELLDRFVEDEPARAPEIVASRARIYADAGNMPQAVAVLNLGTLQYPDSVDLRYAAASLNEDQGNIAVALRQLKAVAKLRPDDPVALNAYGYTLADHHRHLKEARKLIEQAYSSAPKSPAILDSLGWVLFRQGHGDQALPYLNAAFADDRGGDIAAHLGEVLWQLGRHQDAERIWAEGTRTDADNQLLKATRQRLHAAATGS